MLGAICGDVIGSVYEWHNVKTEVFELFSRKSRFTDDTVMTAAVMAKLLNSENRQGFLCSRRSAAEYAAQYQLFFSRYPNAGFGQMFGAWAGSHSTSRQHSYGNGAAMRAAPIGYAFDTLDKVLAEAAISCRYTHAHPEAIRGARAVAGCVFFGSQRSWQE